ncbi:c-type cytochrome [Trinickia caryophylli]|uniref:Cytochrome c5 n=1 Tax=Trinickia caryophylli TaxID=28094 RepID=A0A1X7GP13_TRICW|nr:c-type cytochrome [Trinickia caryophylli]PMS10472.1 cytochrome c5 family protein [Trinickia caryophylli]TRX19135.1 cytochrome c5 family protein [Trinickia caryophylli]WQE13569.1 c-type cytochrome [Trinickia caryophylli]SMF72478.1 Cytochrome c5 [Trinickia caryophylli]GLU35082.1 cytochrome c [Trinickia caryophylli]
MSEAPHGAPIKTPGQLIAAVVAAFVVPIAIIWLLAYNVNQTVRDGAGTDMKSDATLTDRIAPLAQVTVRDANAPRVYKSGEEVFKAVCSTCHATGAAGAPKFGDSSAWAPRIAQGYDALLHSALSGKNAMPARGGTSPDDYSDYEIARAVVYMANNGGAKFAEPAAPAPAGAQAASAASPETAGAASGATAENANPAAAASEQAAAAASSMPVAQPAALPASANTAAAPAAPAPSPATPTASADAAQAGKALYEKVCQACHAAGVLNAPKFGDKAAWAPRLKEGMDVVYNYALHGKGAMPPKGGSNASDADVKAAVDYMANAAK